jgi:hypothetical protein
MVFYIFWQATPVRNAFCLCGSPPLWAMVFPFVGALPPGRWAVVCEGYRDEGVAPTGDNAPHVVGAPPSGRWVVVCEAYRDEGVAPTGDNAPHVVAHPCFLRP